MSEPRGTPRTDGADSHRDRTRARAWALQVHYRWETGGRDGTLREALTETMRTRRIAPSRLPYLRRLLTTLDQHREEVDRALQDALDNWRLERLSAIDRGILRVAATEMLHFEDVPPKVSIKEAMRIAERYGGDESPRFVNGILDGVLRARPGAPSPTGPDGE